jgi:hypothetical protein
MTDIFINNTSSDAIELPAPQTKKRTKKELSETEYLKVCERMAELRAKRKLPNKKQESKLEPMQVNKVDEKVGELKQELKEVNKEVKTNPTDELKEHLLSIKQQLQELRELNKPKVEVKQEPVKVEVKQEPVKVESKPVQPPPKPEPQKLIWSGVMGGFKPFRI